MSSLAAGDQSSITGTTDVIQPVWVRTVHWINAVAMIMMIMSGWQIYNASPLFDFRFSHTFTLGGWLGGASLWRPALRVGFWGAAAMGVTAGIGALVGRAV